MEQLAWWSVGIAGYLAVGALVGRLAIWTIDPHARMDDSDMILGVWAGILWPIFLPLIVLFLGFRKLFGRSGGRLST